MGIARFLKQGILGWLLSLSLAAAYFFIVAATLGTYRRKAGYALLRLWGKGMLRICGISLHIEGVEHATGRQARIVTFNHTSLIDDFVVLALLPDGGVPVVKREILYYPFGWPFLLLDCVVLDRKTPERARASLARVGDRVRQEKLSVFVAPEGTRSRDGELGPFRMGAFHIALQSGVPIVPMVICGAYELMPRGQWYARPGEVSVRFMAPLVTTHYRLETLRDEADRVHAVFSNALLSDNVDPQPSPR